MKLKVKFLLLLLLAINFKNLYAQDSSKSVTLTVNGTGKTKEEATQNALRSAIEQAFGAFISTKTEILNDNLLKDEVVSISNGNIENFKILNDIKLPENLGYSSTLSVSVSIGKLKSFIQSKGFNEEFKGELVAANLRLINLNEQAELTAVKNVLSNCEKILGESIDFYVKVSEPSYANSADTAIFNQFIIAVPNKNYDCFLDYFNKNMRAISLKEAEFNTLKELNHKCYYVEMFFDYGTPANEGGAFLVDSKKVETLTFRNKLTLTELNKFVFNCTKYIYNFSVFNGIDSFDNLHNVEYLSCIKNNIEYRKRVYLVKDFNILLSESTGYIFKSNHLANQINLGGEVNTREIKPSFEFTYNIEPYLENGTQRTYPQMRGETFGYRYRSPESYNTNSFFNPPFGAVENYEFVPSQYSENYKIQFFEKIQNPYCHVRKIKYSISQLEKISKYQVKPIRNNDK